MTSSGLSIGILTARLARGFGVDVVVNRQATELTARGHKVTVYTLHHERSFYGDLKYKVHLFPWMSPEVVRYLRFRNHDCLIAHTSPFFEILPQVSDRFHVFAYEHGDPTPNLFPDPERSRRESVKANKTKNVYGHLDGVIAISKFIAQDIGWPDATVIYNGADHLAGTILAPSREDRRLAKARLELPAERRAILCVSRLGSGEAMYKGLDLYKSLRDRLPRSTFECILLGRGTDDDRRALEASGFRVILNASQAELATAYKACDLYLSFSKWEGFNLPLLEAQMAGCAAMALDSSCHHEVCPFVFSNVDSLLPVLCGIDDAALDVMRRACFESASRFRWSTNIAELDSLLTRACNSRKPAFAPPNLTERLWRTQWIGRNALRLALKKR